MEIQVSPAALSSLPLERSERGAWDSLKGLSLEFSQGRVVSQLIESYTAEAPLCILDNWPLLVVGLVASLCA